MIRRAQSIVCLAVMVAGCGTAFKPDPSLCELAKNRADYAGKTISVEGNLLSSAHGTVLIEPRCRRGIGIDWESDGAHHFGNLDDAAELWDLGPAYVRVVVSGVVRRSRAPGMFGKREWVLDIGSARVLEMYRISDADNDRFYRWLDGPSWGPFIPSKAPRKP